MAESAKSAASKPAPAKVVEEDKPVTFNPDSDKNLAPKGGLTKTAEDELKELGVDPRLDNRTGDQRPVLDPDLKPQQISGPEIGGLAVDASSLADKDRPSKKGDFKVLGSSAGGPLGRGE